jgi:hypothetical protein
MKPIALNEHQVSLFGVLIPKASLISALCYLALALPFAGKIPLVELVMFRFYVPKGKTTFPLFLADGEVASIEDYDRFANLPPEVIDLNHGGYECSVEHKFHDAKWWLTNHQAPRSETPGPVTIEIGMGILFIDENNALHQEHQITGTGTAHPRADE